MTMDIRVEAARYYDLQPPPFEGKDIPFYIARISSPQARILELGCGTGRVLIPLLNHCGFIHGVDISESMVAICQGQLDEQGISPANARVEVADICQLKLEQKFDLIIAPYRVFQNLEADEQIEGFFQTVRWHLAPGGACILNVFRPWYEEARVRERWAQAKEDKQVWETPVGDGRLIAFERIAAVHPEKYICYPVLTYRYFEKDALIEEANLYIAMRCYSAESFHDLILSHGFNIIDQWGGYNGEVYGEGPELVVQFQ
jgi:SAM-dependent methyltransferase